MTIDFETNRVRLPTLGMNPMAKDRVGVFLDALIAFDADGVGEAAMREAEPALGAVPGSYRVALVACDDVAGGRTNRYSCEYAERLAHVYEYGHAKTLRELMARAGCEGPTLDPEDSEYTRHVIAAFLGASDMRTGIECLYEDAAGATPGFTPRGLSHRAGLALALHDARAAVGLAAHPVAG